MGYRDGCFLGRDVHTNSYDQPPNIRKTPAQPLVDEASSPSTAECTAPPPPVDDGRVVADPLPPSTTTGVIGTAAGCFVRELFCRANCSTLGRFAGGPRAPRCWFISPAGSCCPRPPNGRSGGCRRADDAASSPPAVAACAPAAGSDCGVAAAVGDNSCDMQGGAVA